MGIEYYNAAVARLGQVAVDRSIRLYVSPSSTHTGNGRSVTEKWAVPTMADLLDLALHHGFVTDLGDISRVVLLAGPDLGVEHVLQMNW
jgi:hypothetical protein